MTLDEIAPRPVITIPRDLAMPGRILRSALSLVDHVNPFAAVSQPRDLEFDALDRDGQVAGLVAVREAMAKGINHQRRANWRAAFGGVEPEVPLPLTPDEVRRAMGLPFQLSVVHREKTG
jgi:hypothetical protein